MGGVTGTVSRAGYEKKRPPRGASAKGSDMRKESNMSVPIVPEYPDLDDFIDRLTQGEADELLGVKAGTCGAAMDRGELAYFMLPGRKQRFTCRRMLDEWLSTYCKKKVTS